MKKHTKILLLLSSALISLGLILLLGGVVMGARFDRVFQEGLWDVTFYSDDSQSNQFQPNGSYDLSPDGIQDLTINWLDGTITIESYDGAEILIQESSTTALNEKSALNYNVSNGTLTIDYTCSPQVGFVFSSPSGRKDLLVRIPQQLAQGLSNLELYSADGEIYLQGLTIQDVGLSMMDGDVSIEESALSEFNFSSADGNLTVHASSIGSIEMDTMDGDLVGDFSQCPQSIDFDSMDGNMELRLPESSQFLIDWDSLERQNFHSDFPGVQHDGVYIVGDGSAHFSINTMSGALTILSTEE